MATQILSYLGIAFGIIGILATAYFAIRFSEKKDPRYFIRSGFRAFSSPETPDNIQILFNGKAVPRVSSTVIWFWNDGRKPIMANDVPASQPLRINVRDESTPDVEILDVVVRKSTRSSIAFTARKLESSMVEFGFDFLDCKDGAVIEVLHTGSPATRITLSGIVLGAPCGPRKVSENNPHDILGWMLPVLGIRVPTYVKIPFRKRISAAAPALVLGVLVIGSALWLAFNRHPKIIVSHQALTERLSQFVQTDKINEAIRAVIEVGSPFSVYPVFVSLGVILLIVGVVRLLGQSFKVPIPLLLDDSDDWW